VPLLVEGRDLHVTVEARGLEGQRISCAGPDFCLTGVDLALLGGFQPSNALLALAAARVLGVEDAAIRRGLARVRWPGRLEIVRRDPMLVLDGAHNPAGARALAGSLRDLFGGVPLTLVLGVSQDKDAAAIFAALVPLATRVVLTRASNERAADPHVLAAALPAGSPPPEIAGSPAEALGVAMRIPRTPIVCVAGSLFLLGDVLTILAGERDKPCPIEKSADI